MVNIPTPTDMLDCGMDPKRVLAAWGKQKPQKRSKKKTKHKCLDCDKKVCALSQRCRKCAALHRYNGGGK